MSEEWAIQDEATGEWLHHGKPDWRAHINAEDLVHQREYAGACGVLSHDSNKPAWHRDTARIVPAPPREMTDAEAEAWFFDSFLVMGHLPASPNWGVWKAEARICAMTAITLAPNPYNAIRAARRKLENAK